LSRISQAILHRLFKLEQSKGAVCINLKRKKKRSLANESDNNVMFNCSLFKKKKKHITVFKVDD